jgi:FMN-dependent NADH-azoreductase
MGFMGVEDFEAVVVEGVDAIPDQAESFKGAAVNKALEIASVFLNRWCLFLLF